VLQNCTTSLTSRHCSHPFLCLQTMGRNKPMPSPLHSPLRLLPVHLFSGLTIAQVALSQFVPLEQPSEGGQERQGALHVVVQASRSKRETSPHHYHSRLIQQHSSAIASGILHFLSILYYGHTLHGFMLMPFTLSLSSKWDNT